MRIWSRKYLGLPVLILALGLILTACGADDIADDETAPAATDDDDADAEDDADGEEEAASPDRVSMRWATSDVGSYGYSVASYMVDFLNRELPDEYVVTVHPYPSTTAAKKAAMDGEAEISYTADVGMVEYFARTGPYEGYEPEVGDLVHTFYAYPMETFLVTTEDMIDDSLTEPVFQNFGRCRPGSMFRQLSSR